MPDLREPDPIADANQRIRAYVQALPGGKISPEHRGEYDQLVNQFMTAVQQRDPQHCDEAGPSKLAA